MWGVQFFIDLLYREERNWRESQRIKNEARETADRALAAARSSPRHDDDYELGITIARFAEQQPSPAPTDPPQPPGPTTMPPLPPKSESTGLQQAMALTTFFATLESPSSDVLTRLLSSSSSQSCSTAADVVGSSVSTNDDEDDNRRDYGTPRPAEIAVSPTSSGEKFATTTGGDRHEDFGPRNITPSAAASTVLVDNRYNNPYYANNSGDDKNFNYADGFQKSATLEPPGPEISVNPNDGGGGGGDVDRRDCGTAGACADGDRENRPLWPVQISVSTIPSGDKFIITTQLYEYARGGDDNDFDYVDGFQEFADPSSWSSTDALVSTAMNILDLDLSSSSLSSSSSSTSTETLVSNAMDILDLDLSSSRPPEATRNRYYIRQTLKWSPNDARVSAPPDYVSATTNTTSMYADNRSAAPKENVSRQRAVPLLAAAPPDNRNPFVDTLKRKFDDVDGSAQNYSRASPTATATPTPIASRQAEAKSQTHKCNCNVCTMLVELSELE